MGEAEQLELDFEVPEKLVTFFDPILGPIKGPPHERAAR